MENREELEAIFTITAIDPESEKTKERLEPFLSSFSQESGAFVVRFLRKEYFAHFEIQDSYPQNEYVDFVVNNDGTIAINETLVGLRPLEGVYFDSKGRSPKTEGQDLYWHVGALGETIEQEKWPNKKGVYTQFIWNVMKEKIVPELNFEIFAEAISLDYNCISAYNCLQLSPKFRQLLKIAPGAAHILYRGGEDKNPLLARIISNEFDNLLNLPLAKVLAVGVVERQHAELIGRLDYEKVKPVKNIVVKWSKVADRIETYFLNKELDKLIIGLDKLDINLLNKPLGYAGDLFHNALIQESIPVAEAILRNPKSAIEKAYLPFQNYEDDEPLEPRVAISYVTDWANSLAGQRQIKELKGNKAGFEWMMKQAREWHWTNQLETYEEEAFAAGERSFPEPPVDKIKLGAEYQLEYLKNVEALLQESRQMRHCVISYWYNCYEGYSFIYSLNKKGQKIATIEVLPDGRVNQIRGPFNQGVDSSMSVELNELFEEKFSRHKVKERRASPRYGIWGMDFDDDDIPF